MKYIALTLSLLLFTACTTNTADTTSDQKKIETPAETVKKKGPKIETVKIVEFFDYACPHCRNAHFTIEKLKTKYGDKIEVTEKHFPLSAQTFLVAETAECARDQGKFKEYHTALLEENFRQYDPENLQKIAEDSGLDIKKFNLCAVNGIGKTRVQEDVNYAKSLGVKGTPFFLLNESIPLSGAAPEKTFSRLIQQVLDGEIN